MHKLFITKINTHLRGQWCKIHWGSVTELWKWVILQYILYKRAGSCVPLRDWDRPQSLAPTMRGSVMGHCKSIQNCSKWSLSSYYTIILTFWWFRGIIRVPLGHLPLDFYRHVQLSGDPEVDTENLNRCYISSGLGMPQDPSGGSEKCCCHRYPIPKNLQIMDG